MGFEQFVLMHSEAVIRANKSTVPLSLIQWHTHSSSDTVGPSNRGSGQKIQRQEHAGASFGTS